MSPEEAKAGALPAPDLLERLAGAEAASARRHPVKAAKRLGYYRHQLEAGTLSAGELAALPARIAALEAALSGVACKLCGRPLRDTTQPGYADGVGPECIKKVTP